MGANTWFGGRRRIAMFLRTSTSTSTTSVLDR
eukprot:CAMPEP_0183453230 /NCGR_PEP_ID=MMETSP0370-20130417/120372_1 /TAXON_ID=268820 /ORGANISM="Peridinium aciculiferum, Strain PAER-2" /LENGTH=31 /DNA_ID= /DNA_START= /DNA_END= /DNA_ORIENTATION=